MEQRFDLIVIGAGPGGYVAAIKAAKAGMQVAVVEEDAVGGTCLNRGCIPAKALIHASSLYRQALDGERYGILAKEVSYDYAKILSYKEETTEKLCQGVDQLLKGNKVTLLHGKGRLEKDRTVTVISGEGIRTYEAGNVILAAGSQPMLLPLPGMELKGVLTSNELLKLKEAPESLAIIGGGVISVEFATAFAALGTQVSIVEAMPRLVPGMDREISQNLKMILKKRGVDIHTSATVQEIVEKDGLYACRFLEKEKAAEIVAQYVLCAVGRRANTDGLFGEGVSLSMDHGRIAVDERMQTSMDGVYAIGDLVKGMQLAHLASAQGIFVAEVLSGKAPVARLDIVPGCVYTDPEIASVGMTEEEAKSVGIEIKTGKCIMSANGKSLITKEERGFIKVVVDARSEAILGAQMMCARATDMIGELGTAIANNMTAGQLLIAMRAHPTYNEGVAEALEDAVGEAVHAMPRKKR